MFCRGILEKIQPARRAFGKRKEKRIKGKRYGSGSFCISFFHNERDIDGAENYIRDRKTVS
jgi:hypothetical protein